MEQFNYFIAIIILFGSYIIMKISTKYARTGIEKHYIVMIAIFTTIYSGMGISFEYVSNKYLISFFLFLITILTGLNIGYRMISIRKPLYWVNSLVTSNYKITKIVFFIYWAIIIFGLLYPVNRMAYVFNPSISVSGVFASQTARRANMIVYMIGIISLIIRPIYFISLYRLKSNILPSLLIIFEVYLGIVTHGYIGRSSMLVYLLLIVLLYIYKKEYNPHNKELRERKSKIKIRIPHIVISKFRKKRYRDSRDAKSYLRSKKAFIYIVVIVIMLLPLLFEYQYYRLGTEQIGLSRLDSVYRLLDIEFGFPKNYDVAQQISSSVSPMEYFKWFFTLIIPKQILPISDVLLINYEFSANILGLNYGEPGFYVFLPSLLGEGIILYGWQLSFLHGLFLGIVAGMFCSFYQKSEVLVLWNVYVISQLVLMPRGGSQGVISMLVNGSVVLFILAFLNFFVRRRETT